MSCPIFAKRVFMSSVKNWDNLLSLFPRCKSVVSDNITLSSFMRTIKLWKGVTSILLTNFMPSTRYMQLNSKFCVTKLRWIVKSGCTFLFLSLISNKRTNFWNLILRPLATQWWRVPSAYGFLRAPYTPDWLFDWHLQQAFHQNVLWWLVEAPNFVAEIEIFLSGHAIMKYAFAYGFLRAPNTLDDLIAI